MIPFRLPGSKRDARMSLEGSFIDCETSRERCSCRIDGAYMHPTKRDVSPFDEMLTIKYIGEMI